jgi:hypothetical protein
MPAPRFAYNCLMAGALVTFSVPMLFAQSGEEWIPKLMALFRPLPAVVQMAQASHFPMAVLAGKIALAVCSVLAIAILSATPGFLGYMKAVLMRFGLAKRLFTAATAIFLVLAPWLVPYGGGTWARQVNLYLNQYPPLLGVFFSAQYVLTVSGILFVLGYMVGKVRNEADGFS